MPGPAIPAEYKETEMQGMKKRAMALSAALALALSLAACDSADPDNGTDDGDLGGVTTTLGGDLGATTAPGGDDMVTTTLAP